MDTTLPLKLKFNQFSKSNNLLLYNLNLPGDNLFNENNFQDRPYRYRQNKKHFRLFQSFELHSHFCI